MAQAKSKSYPRRASRDGASTGNPLAFSMLWGSLMAGLVAIEIGTSAQGFHARTLALILLFGLGGLSGALFARLFAGLISQWHPQPSARFSAMLIGLSCGTAGMTTLFHFLHFRIYYAQWHDTPLSPHWFFEQIMTGIGSAYIFVVEGMPLLLPWGLPLLLAASWDYAAPQSQSPKASSRGR